MSEREALLRRFLEGAGWGAAERRVLAADASFRRYDRLVGAAGRAVLMDAPPEHEKPASFVRLAELLGRLGLSAPRILAADLERGFVLLEDLGDDTFTHALAAGREEAPLYRLAVDTLVALQRAWSAELGAGIPPYDQAAFLAEAELLTGWYLPAASGREPDRDTLESYREAWRAVLPTVERLPRTLVLRDYHVDNLMVLEGRQGVAACGLLDFQDALIGPPAYDLVSLLRDARRDVDQALAADLLAHFRAARPELDGAALEAAYWVLGAQRSSKIIGIFTRLSRRDGKARYLEHLPRLWRWLEEELRHPELAPVAAWFERHLPPELRGMPEAKRVA
ncbi:MAG: phosphotransferase [Tistlia sp.]|uniref:aminoglycoside phosphotransferase family protein n=1 Tax=Tistlia sp. TaxID=3057121 RepID=UPI0034A35DE2